MHGRRTLPRALVAALVLIALVAVGAATAGTEPLAQHTTADMKRAQQLVLVGSDLGRGWKQEGTAAATGTTAGSALRCSGYAPDLAGLIETGTATGRSFSFDDGNAFYSVGSAATVMKTSRMTTQVWNRSIRPEIVSCFRSAFVRGLQLGSSAGKQAAPTVRFGEASVFAPSAATQRKVGFRLTAAIRFPDQGGDPLPVVIDVVFLAQGRHLSFATIASLGDRPPTALEKAISGRLAARIARGAGPTA
jgi:hypothetical protein